MKAAGGVLTVPRRPGIAPALGLRAAAMTFSLYADGEEHPMREAVLRARK